MMDLRRFDRLDVGILVSLLNMKLRNDYHDLDDLARARDIDKTALEHHLAAHGYRYLDAVRQFRATVDN